MSKNTVVVLTRDQEGFAKKLSALDLPDLEIILPANVDDASADVAKANILLAIPYMAKKYINEAKGVVWMQSVFTGIDAMNDPNLRKDYTLTNVRDVYGEVMSEYVLSYILLFEKLTLENIEYQKQKVWAQKNSPQLRGKSICILGAGSIGHVIAGLAKSFHMRTLGYYREGDTPGKNFDELFTGEALKDCLGQADYVVSVLPKTTETDDIINKKTLSYMKNTAVFINIGRGNAVNEEDLVEALNNKVIAKAVLDVFKTEPLPPESPLWDVPNLYITPHMSGYFVSDKVLEIFEENYHKFLKGEKLRYLIDLEKGY